MGRNPQHPAARPAVPPPVSLRRVAERAGVSTATVSRVINGLDVVSPQTVARVRSAMQELRYRPNRTARALITRRNMVLGLSVPEISSEFYARVIAGAERGARERGYHLLVTSHHAEGDLETMNFSADLLDGAMIVVTEQIRRDRFLMAFDDSVPVVVLGHPHLAEAADLPTVGFDNRVGARAATLHLLEGTAASRCYFVGGPETNTDARRRAAGFESVLRESGHEPRPDQISFGRFETATGRAWGLAAAERGVLRGSAVLAANDEIALGIVYAASDAGLVLPDDLRVVGFDDSAVCGSVRPELSSVRAPSEELGRRGAELLIDLIVPGPDAEVDRSGAGTHAGIGAETGDAGEDQSPEPIRLRTELIIRGSSAITRGRDP